jgi:hypothetical protein
MGCEKMIVVGDFTSVGLVKRLKNLLIPFSVRTVSHVPKLNAMV